MVGCKKRLSSNGNSRQQVTGTCEVPVTSSNKIMNPGWYILNYHDISWEESAYTRAIGGNLPPDIFRSHLDALSQNARLVSVPDGFERFRAGRYQRAIGQYLVR